MKMRAKAVMMVSAVVMLGGCYRITVTHGPQPAANVATVVDFPWQHSWVFGLVPPPEINVRDRCPAGVAKVQTQVSFLNGLASALVGIAVGEAMRSSGSDTTYYYGGGAAGIWQPQSAKVTCAPR